MKDKLVTYSCDVCRTQIAQENSTLQAKRKVIERGGRYRASKLYCPSCLVEQEKLASKGVKV